MNSLLFLNARVIDPASQRDGQYDVWVHGNSVGAIEAPGKLLKSSKDEIKNAKKIDAKNKWLCPGLIDAHVHLRDPGHEYKETIASGLSAAAKGGFSSVACMANTLPVHDHAAVTRYILDRAARVKKSRVFPVGAVTKNLQGQELAEIGLMVEAGARAISDDGMPIMNSFVMRKAMEYAKSFGIAIISHAEDLNLSQSGNAKYPSVMNEGAVSSLYGLRGNPKASEEVMVAREIALARLTRSKLHLAHLSTKEAIRHLKQAKEDGLDITGEVTPHHLLLTDIDVCRHFHHQDATHYKMAPPLRGKEDVEALIEALNQGIIDIIASDHAPHGCVDKETEFEMAANGILGLETTLSLMLGLVQEKKLKLNRMVEALTLAPAKMLGLPHLGKIDVGCPADLTLIDPEISWELKKDDLVSKSINTPFTGKKFKGRIALTMVNGEIIYEAAGEGKLG